jgi:phenylalanyl-tRNA synthetase beta chain
VEYCLRRAALLIRELTGGTISSDVVDLYPNKQEDYQVFLTFDKINNLIGQEIPKDTIKAILASLDIQVKNVTESGLGLIIPFYRIDVRREVDVIEEILRIYGYNNIATSEKLHASVASTTRFEDHRLENTIGDLLVSHGFYETLSNSLTNPEYQELIGQNNGTGAVTILNPLSKELSVMRQTLLTSLLESTAHNINRRRQDLKLFEFGTTYLQKNDGFTEAKQLSMVITGNRLQESWIETPGKTDFFYLKAIVEQVLQRLGISDYDAVPIGKSVFSEGLTFCSGKLILARFGLLEQRILKKFDIKADVFYANFDWAALVRKASQARLIYSEVPKYPEVRRDFALLLDESVSFKQIRDLAFRTERKLLTKVNLFDVYTGNKLADGKKSYAVSFILQDTRKTLTDAQIDKIMGKLQRTFEKELGAELR